MLAYLVVVGVEDSTHVHHGRSCAVDLSWAARRVFATAPWHWQPRPVFLMAVHCRLALPSGSAPACFFTHNHPCAINSVTTVNVARITEASCPISGSSFEWFPSKLLPERCFQVRCPTPRPYSASWRHGCTVSASRAIITLSVSELSHWAQRKRRSSRGTSPRPTSIMARRGPDTKVGSVHGRGGNSLIAAV